MFRTSATAISVSTSYAKACFCDNQLMSAADSLNQKENKWVSMLGYAESPPPHTHAQLEQQPVSQLHATKTKISGNTLDSMHI